MKVEIVIEGNPKINQSICHTKNGKQYIPGQEKENERILRAAVISRLAYDFKPFTGPVLINKLHFAFPPTFSFSDNEREQISSGSQIVKNLKPNLADCLRDIIKSLTGTLFINESQICGIIDFKKFYSSRPGIILEIEELK